MVAFLFCEKYAINFTVGWKDYTLLNTFYSLDVNNIVQSAGNYFASALCAVKIADKTMQTNKFSSETIRERASFSLYFGSQKLYLRD